MTPERTNFSSVELIPEPSPEETLERAAKATHAFIEASTAPNTRRAYRADWTDFCEWCAPAELSTMTAEPKTVAGYIAYLADTHEMKASTIGRRLAAINKAHETAGHLSPTKHPLVQRTWAGIKRSLGTDSAAGEESFVERRSAPADRCTSQQPTWGP